MIFDVLSKFTDDRRQLIIGTINMAEEIAWEIQSCNNDDYNNDQYWIDSENLINRFYGDELGDEILSLSATRESLFKRYECDDDWHQIDTNYLRLEYVKMFESNDIKYAAIKKLDNDCYDIFVKHENNLRLFELLFRDLYTIVTPKLADEVFTKANWCSINSFITDDDLQNYETHISEYGKQYMDWLAEYNINYYETYPLRIASKLYVPKIYFKYEEHIESFKSMIIEIKMLHG